MKEKTILVIDDSATIRRLVNNELSSDGYHVLAEPTAEAGVETAWRERPDLIILDHQLPGTTGYEVCCKLLQRDELAKIPVVISSTLRKKAYVEYVDCPNVVDMLPKPYSGELLLTTIGNAIETASMVVESQEGGTAVPEVIGQVSDSDLSGAFDCFSLREILDMLNNCNKCGVVEIEASQSRFWIYLENGRIQAIVGAGIDADEVNQFIPDSLSELAPVIKFTMSGRKCSEIDGLVELLDKKVLDPRLLTKLLRIQAAALIRFCLTRELKSFRFEKDKIAPPLFRKLPLNTSLLALTVEGAMRCDENCLPVQDIDCGFVRRTIRGQNLDRTGLESQHLKLMGMLKDVTSPEDLAKRTGMSSSEVQRVLHGFELAELVEQKPLKKSVQFVCIARQTEVMTKAREMLDSSDKLSGKVVRDWLALDILTRRNPPNVLMVSVENENSIQQLQKLRANRSNEMAGVRLIAVSENSLSPDVEQVFDEVLLQSDTVERFHDAVLGVQNVTSQIETVEGFDSPTNGQFEAVREAVL